jgi:hypothetical protein
MPFFERIIGFSTGAVAKGDFRRALLSLRNLHVHAVELSALREHELPELIRSLPLLDLSEFAYVSVHAPTKLVELQEREIVHLLEDAASLHLPIVVHPDVVQSPELWRPFGSLLLIENMDKRKPIGRTAAELRIMFDRLPQAAFCFDVAHARQVDPTMIESTEMLQEFKDRLGEVHASGLSSRSTHGPISAAGSFAYGNVAHLIPETIPIILESPVDESLVRDEINYARNAFSPWLDRLRFDIDDVLDLKIETLRRAQVANFLSLLRMTHIKLSDLESVISHLPSGGAYGSGEVLYSARDLLNKLSEEQKAQLRHHLLHRMRQLAAEYPDLKAEFREQFAAME